MGNLKKSDHFTSQPKNPHLLEDGVYCSSTPGILVSLLTDCLFSVSYWPVVHFYKSRNIVKTLYNMTIPSTPLGKFCRTRTPKFRKSESFAHTLADLVNRVVARQNTEWLASISFYWCWSDVMRNGVLGLNMILHIIFQMFVDLDNWSVSHREETIGHLDIRCIVVQLGSNNPSASWILRTIFHGKIKPIR